MGMGEKLLSGYNRTRKAGMKKRKAMPVNRYQAPEKKAKPEKRVVFSQSNKPAADKGDGERIKVKKSQWRGRWHK